MHEMQPNIKYQLQLSIWFDCRIMHAYACIYMHWHVAYCIFRRDSLICTTTATTIKSKLMSDSICSKTENWPDMRTPLPLSLYLSALSLPSLRNLHFKIIRLLSKHQSKWIFICTHSHSLSPLLSPSLSLCLGVCEAISIFHAHFKVFLQLKPMESQSLFFHQDFELMPKVFVGISSMEFRILLWIAEQSSPFLST